ncbi:MAG: hypothetical protein M3354_07980 [Chloroflexota bacterium]|nr:hypothetical protein [Chloroflexota bacterium]
MASAKGTTGRQEQSIQRAAEQLLDLARSRTPAPSVYLYTVGDIADTDRPWQNPDPSTESRIWRDRHAAKPERMVDTLRTLLTPSKREIYSTSYLLDQVKAAAVDIGVSLIEHRDHQRAHLEAREHVEQLVDRLSTADERWDVILPILNLRLATRQSEIRIGPMRLIRDELGEYVFDGRDTARLGEFGQWAVKSYDLTSDERRAKWQRTFQEISSFAKVGAIPGDQRAALERAKRDTDTALAILRMSYYLYGSYFDRERYGTFGGHYDPIQRFDVMGSEMGGLRIALAAPAHPSQPLGGSANYRLHGAHRHPTASRYQRP